MYYVVKQYSAHMLYECVILQYFAYFNYAVLSLERIENVQLLTWTGV